MRDQSSENKHHALALGADENHEAFYESLPFVLAAITLFSMFFFKDFVHPFLVQLTNSLQ